MKYSLAIVALLGLTSAIKIQADPVPINDEAAQKAAEPPKEPTKAKQIVHEALKTEDEKSQEAANLAGQPIDVSNAPEAVPVHQEKKFDKDGKEIKPIPLTPEEQTRNHVIRVAASGQEAIDNNNRDVQANKEKYEAKAIQQAEDEKKAAADESIRKQAAEAQAIREHHAKNDTPDEQWTASHQVLQEPVKQPILQSTVVYAQNQAQAEIDKMIDDKFNPQGYGTPEAKSPFAHSDNEEVRRIQNHTADTILPYSSYMEQKTL